MFGFRGRSRSLLTNRYGKGKAVFCPDELATLLAALRDSLPPDIEFVEASPYVGFQHRRAGSDDFYFLVNTGEQAYDLDAVFRVEARHSEVWNPRTGGIYRPRFVEQTPRGPRLRLLLESYESVIVRFAPAASTAPLQPLETRENGTYGVSSIPAPLVLALRWRLRCDSAGEIDLNELRSWTEFPALRYFSGRGDYAADFDFPSAYQDLGVFLDLGRVHETAAVEINGRAAGVAWMRPYRLDVTRLLRPGRNHLRVSVTNLLINKVLGDGPIDYSAVIARYGDRFPAGDEWDLVREPFVSGLLGPVRLVFYRQARAGGP